MEPNAATRWTGGWLTERVAGWLDQRLAAIEHLERVAVGSASGVGGGAVVVVFSASTSLSVAEVHDKKTESATKFGGLRFEVRLHHFEGKGAL